MEMLARLHKKLRGSSVVYLYFVLEGMVYTCFHAAIYPIFGQYLNIPGHQFNSLRSVFDLAWSLKLFFSFFSDSLPIFGYRRLPYITLGLTTILTSLGLLGLSPLPDPYYATANCTKLVNEEPLNPNAPNQAFVYMVLFFFWCIGVSWADATVDGLMTQRSKLEDEKVRGTLISYTRLSGQVGGVISLICVGLLLNSVNYGGTFCEFGMEFNNFAWIPFAVAVSGVFYACMYTNEKDVDKHKEEVAFKRKLKELWALLHRWNYLKLLIFAGVMSIQWSLRTPAGIKVQVHWAEVEPLVSSGVNILTTVISGLGMLIYMRLFLSSNWRFILILVVGLHMLFELPVVALTVFNVIRNQYFWFVDDIFDSVIRFWFVYVLQLIMVEYAPCGIEGISYALIWVVVNIGRAMGSAIANFIMSPFCLTENIRYREDTALDRWTVWISYLMSFGFQTCILFTVFLIPKQKQQAKVWRENCENDESGKSWNAVIFAALGIVGLIGATVLNFMTMFESTRCYMIAGGPGCDISGRRNCLWYPHKL